MTNEELAAFFRTSATHSLDGPAIAIATGASPSTVGAVSAAAPVAAALFNLAADIAESGHDPAVVIARIADAKPWLDATETEWAARIAKKPV